MIADANSLFDRQPQFPYQRKRAFRWLWHQLRTDDGVDYKKYVRHSFRILPPLSLWWWKRNVPKNRQPPNQLPEITT